MRIDPVLIPKIVTDYEFHFSSEVSLPITICEADGDTKDFDTSPLVVIFHIAERPSLSDPDASIPAEDITVFLKEVMFLTKRSREVMPLAPEQQEAFKKLIQRDHPTVQ